MADRFSRQAVPESLEARIVRCCRRLAELGLNAGSDGNVSVRASVGRVVVTPAGGLKADLSIGDLVEVDLEGNQIGGTRRPTSELGLHLRVMRARSDVGAVVHAHPPTATGLNLAGVPVDSELLPELTVLVGEVATVPFALPGSDELGEGIAKLIVNHDVLMLDHHGAVAVGDTLEEAQIRMETLEHAAKSIFAARLLGGPKSLSEHDRTRLKSMRRNSRVVQ